VAQDWRDARIGELEQQLSRALERIADLERLLGRSSRNSRRKPGGQPGHKAKMRALLPPEKVTSTEEHFPPRCLSCGDKLPRQKDESPLIHQVVELPEIEADVTEHRCTGSAAGVAAG
jgi:transposase